MQDRPARVGLAYYAVITRKKSSPCPVIYSDDPLKSIDVSCFLWYYGFTVRMLDILQYVKNAPHLHVQIFASANNF